MALVVGGLGGVQSLRAAPRWHSQQPSPTWHAVETANFRILSFGASPVDSQTAQSCEAMRASLAKRWLGGGVSTRWSPKCELVLHPSEQAYLREVGPAGARTVGSSLINRQAGRISGRRIDIGSTKTDWRTAALAHELAHLILADRFGEETLSRWVDEGVAILADTAEKQGRHRADLQDAFARRGTFRILELLSLSEYPSAAHWGTFYGQSASLVAYLVGQGGEERFIEFVQASFDDGYERGLRRFYGFGIAELERRWQLHLTGQSSDALAQQAGRHRSAAQSILPTLLEN